MQRNRYCCGFENSTSNIEEKKWQYCDLNARYVRHNEMEEEVEILQTIYADDIISFDLKWYIYLYIGLKFNFEVFNF